MNCDVEYQQIVNVNIDENVYTLNLIGSVFTEGVGTKSDVVYIPDIQIVFEDGDRQSIDISQYIKKGQMYVPIMFFQDSLAEYIAPNIIFQPAGETVDFYKAPDTPVGRGATGNYITLIPVDYEQGSIGGISNGQYYTNPRYYSKSEVDALIGKTIIIEGLTAFFNNSTNGYIDVSNHVEDGKAYIPLVFFPDSDAQDFYQNVAFLNTLTQRNQIRVTYKDSTISSAVIRQVVLIPLDSSETFVAGLSNGQINSLLATKQNTLTFDTTPTQGSTNPVTSGGIYNVIGDIETLLHNINSGE